jgi:hypothetical protein
MTDTRDRALALGDKMCAAEELLGKTAGQIMRAALTGDHTTANVACLNVTKLRHIVGELANLSADFEKSLR